MICGARGQDEERNSNVIIIMIVCMAAKYLKENETIVFQRSM